MTKLTLAASMTVFAVALAAPEAQAGTPMMDEPMSISVGGETSCSKKNCISAGAATGQNDIGARWGYNASGYKLYRDRMGHGLKAAPATNGRR
jgi:hypothetical protein